jgi:hypothetical protein
VPLKNARIQKFTNYGALHTGHDIFMYSSTDSVVNAMETSVVLAVTFADNEWAIVMRGKYTIGYGNFSKVLVKKGDHVKAGSRIGILNPYSSEWFLDLSIERHGKSLSAENIF